LDPTVLQHPEAQPLSSRLTTAASDLFSFT
jgi:hypothetical protein